MSFRRRAIPQQMPYPRLGLDGAVGCCRIGPVGYHTADTLQEVKVVNEVQLLHAPNFRITHAAPVPSGWCSAGLSYCFQTLSRLTHHELFIPRLTCTTAPVPCRISVTNKPLLLAVPQLISSPQPHELHDQMNCQSGRHRTDNFRPTRIQTLGRVAPGKKGSFNAHHQEDQTDLQGAILIRSRLPGQSVE